MQNSPQLDLTGKLIIKVALGEDIRRIPIHNEDITYDELVLMMQRVFRGKLSTNDEITIKYKDEDGDLITIFDSSDLTFAIQCSRILKITLFVGGSKTALQPMETAGLKQELQQIRDQVIGILDRLDNANNVAASQSFNISSMSELKVGEENGKGAASGIKLNSKPVNVAGGKEFDPLSTQRSLEDSHSKVASGDGAISSTPQAYDRAATPDSVSSVGSSASHKNRSQQPSLMGSAPPHTPQPTSSPAQQQQSPFPPQQQSGGYQSFNHGQGQIPQTYAGQPAFSAQQPQQPQPPQPTPQPQSGYDQNIYSHYNQSYAGAPSQPGQIHGQMQYGQGQPGQGQPGQPGQGQPGQPGQGQPGQPGHGQPQLPGLPQPGQPTNQQGPFPGAPGMPQQAPGFPPGPGMGQAAGGNPYSRGGPGYGTGYPRPSAGYPQ